MCACADVLNFKYRNFKIFLLKLGSELQNFIKKFQPVLKYNKMQTAFPQSGMNNDSFHSLSEIAKSLISGLICKDYLLKIKS